MTQPTVLVVGDFLVDRYWVGEVSRVSPEAPIPVVKITNRFDLPGGAGNVARNLRALGVEYVNLHTRQCPIKNRLMVGDVQLARWDEHDRCFPLPLHSEYFELAPTVDALVIADYLKGTVYDYLIEDLASFNLPTFVDTKGDPTPYLTNFRDVTVFPNLKEYSQHRDVYDQFSKCVLKCSAEGLRFLQYGQCLQTVPSSARYVRCVSGAGDTVVAAYTAAILKGLRSPLHYAAWAAGQVVEKPYTAVPDVPLKEEFRFAA